MNIKATLAKLDEVLGIKPTKIVAMTKAQFEEHVTSELTKAKADAEEDDAEKKEKARKRIAHLRTVTKLLVQKGSWEGGNDGAIPIPVYEEGFEPPTYLPTEEGGDMLGGKGTQADGAAVAAAPGGAQGFAEAGGSKGASGTTVPASGTGTQSDNTIFSGGMTKALGDLAEVMKSLAPTTEATPPAAPPARTGYVDDPTAWPKDLANPSFLKEGVAKRDTEWGADPAGMKRGA